MKKLKKLVLLTIGSFLVLSLATTRALAPPPVVFTQLSCPDVLDTNLYPMSTFSVNITVSNVERLYGFEIILTFDPAVLMAIGYSAYYPFIEEWPGGIGWDYVSLAFSAALDNPDGLTTKKSVPIATIDFVVLDYAWSALDLHDTVLARVTGLGAEAIYHETSDGLFANILLERSDLHGRAAWAEHAKWDALEDPDQTLYGIVKNHGTTSMVVLVKFRVRNLDGVCGDGLWSKTFESAPATVAPRRTITLSTIITPSALSPGPGTYYVSAQCYYDLDGNGSVDTSGAKIKSFAFELV